MNTFDFLIDVLPILASFLSFTASIVMSYMTKKIESKAKNKRNSKITIKLNDIEVKISDRNEEEILKLITNFKNGDEFQKEPSCKREMK